MRRWRIIIAVLVAVLLAVVISVQAAPKVGSKAPDFVLKNLEGKDVSLQSEIESHQVTLINFWGAWCPWCVREIPEFVSFYAKYADSGVQILGVDYGDSVEKAKSFVSDQGMTYPVLIDQNGSVSTKTYGVTGWPTTFIVDKDGMVTNIIIGATDSKTLEQKVLPLLK